MLFRDGRRLGLLGALGDDDGRVEPEDRVAAHRAGTKAGANIRIGLSITPSRTAS